MPHFLAISGSLRAVSSNTVLLQAAALLAPAGTTIALYPDLAALPAFNPDLEADLPPIVATLHRLVGDADGLLIASPEYARGIPGALKNALDWLVGSETFPGKPVALFNASPRASDAQAALRLVLTTMSARIVDEACITVPLLAKGMSAEAIAAEVGMAGPVRAAFRVMAEVARESSEEV